MISYKLVLNIADKCKGLCKSSSTFAKCVARRSYDGTSYAQGYMLRFHSTSPVMSTMATMPAGTQAQVQKQPSSLTEFDKVLPSLVKDVLSAKMFTEVPEGGVWIQKVLQYNVTGGKKNRGMTTVFAYEFLENPDKITPETLRLAAVMGWCVEFLQSYLIMLDDIMDGSHTRRGVPCWYKQPNVGLSGVNDAILVQGAIHIILKKNFRDTPYYSDILDLFNEVLFHTSMGQHLDWVTANRDKSDFSLFTMSRYNAIVKYKTAYYTYLLPVRLALLLANNRSEEMHKHVDDICLKIGQFFQMQDDYIDLYGNSSLTGKVGTDIQEAKCSWFAVSALQLCNPDQLKVMTTCYGSKNPSDVEKVKTLYDELGLHSLYLAKERESYEDIRNDISRLPEGLSQELFVKLLDQIYKRKA